VQNIYEGIILLFSPLECFVVPFFPLLLAFLLSGGLILFDKSTSIHL